MNPPYFRALAVLFVVAIAVGGLLYSTSDTAHATSCPGGSINQRSLTHFSVVDQITTTCVSNTSSVEIDIQNNNNITETINLDTWQTRATNSGGTRYYRSGRSGWITFPPDNQFYTFESFSTGVVLPPPSWGCNWEAFYNGQAFDYQCVQIIEA